ncbi:MAG: hypothetical protein NC218_04950 [Acetobacter sp.]|nr:hypothetical protein [Acetobacter sp.]
MLKLGFEPEKIFLFCKKTLLPELLTGGFFIYFFTISEFSESSYNNIHTFFITATLSALLIAIYFRIMSVITAVSVIYISYIVISAQRYLYGEDYVFSAGYNIWSMLIFPNLLMSYFLFNRKNTSKHWSWFFVFLFAETAIIEKLQNPNLNADSYYFYKHIGMLNYPALYLAIISLFIFFSYYIKRGKILGTAAFFSTLMVFMGILWSDNLFAFNLFLFAAVAVELVTMLCYLHYVRFKDEELDIAGLRAYAYEAERKYPLKYSISLMYVDDYERLLKRFGYRKTILLKKMFINRIKKVNPEVQIYNYKDDALVLAFLNFNAPESFEKAEDIRRSLVKSIFVFNENNHLQLSVSQCVSEKKRSDIDALAVLERAEENLQKACKFTRNITIKA